MTSQARIEANQKNAQKSTGPKTAEGKARTRLNGLKHGMRAETIVLPTEDLAEFAAELQAWTEDWKPPTAARKILVERGAVAAWRLRRSVRVETERLERLGKQAVECYEQELAAQIAEGMRWLKADPPRALAILNLSYEGVAAQIEMWQYLAGSAADPTFWHNMGDHHERLLNLLGWTAFEEGDVGTAGDHSLRLYLLNNPEVEDPQGLLTPEDARRVASRLHEIVLSEIETLRVSLEHFETPEAVRDRIMEASYLDASPEGKCLMRYEAQHDRSLRASITQLMQLTKTGADLTGWEDEAPSEPNDVVNAVVGKSSDGTRAAEGPREVELRKEVGPDAPSEAKGEAVFTSISQAERDRGGRVWAVGDGPAAEMGPSDR